MFRLFQSGDVIYLEGRVYEIGFEHPRHGLMPLIPTVISAHRGWCQTGPRIWVSRKRVEAKAITYESARAKPPKRRRQCRTHRT
jgi:hypothetical protein